jgi:hypothetical protein
MKHIWSNETETKRVHKRVNLYWLYRTVATRRKYICSFICESDAREVANHMGNGWKVAKRTEKPQICP